MIGNLKIIFVACILIMVFIQYFISTQNKWLDFTHEADNLVQEGKYQEAYNLQKKAVQRSKSLFSNKRNTKLAFAENGLGNICSAMGNYNEAVSCFLQAGEIYLTTFGKNDDTVATSYCGLGGAYLKMGELSEAEDFSNESISIFTKNHGDCFENNVTAKSILGQIYFEEKKYESSENIYLELLKCISSGGVSLGYQIFIYSQLGIICQYEKKYKLEEHYYEEAQMLSQEDPNTSVRVKITNLRNMAIAFFLNKKFDESENSDTQILELVNSTPGDFSWEKAGVFLSFAQNEKGLKNINKTREYIGEAMSEYAKVGFEPLENKKGFLEPCLHIYLWLGDYKKQKYIQRLMEELSS